MADASTSAAVQTPEPGGGHGDRRISARAVALAVGGALLGLVALLALASPSDTDDVTALLGNRAPEIDAPTLDGGRFDLDDHRGSWVLVNFFATWCPPCVNEHPELVALDEWGRDRGDLQLVAVVFNDDPAAVEQFFGLRGGGWPVVDDPTVAVDYRVPQIPETFLVAPDGRVVLHVEGEVSAPRVIDVIEGRA